MPSILVDPVISALPDTFRLPVMSTSFDALKYVSPSNQSVSVPEAPANIKRWGGSPSTLYTPPILL